MSISGIEGVMNNMTQYAQRIQAAIDKALEDALKLAFGDLVVYTGARAKEMFDESVEEFYGAYSPKFYSRTESLYNLIQIQPEPDIQNLHIEFEPSAMSQFERGGGTGEDGLYALVFRQGYHGGAPDKNDGNTIKYRTPYPYFSRWGRSAFQSESALTIMKRKWNEYLAGEAKDKLQEFFSKRMSQIKISI